MRYIDATFSDPIDKLRLINLAPWNMLSGPRADVSGKLMSELAKVVRHLGTLGGDDKIAPIVRALAYGAISHEDGLSAEIVDAAVESLLSIGTPAAQQAIERGAMNSRRPVARAFRRARRKPTRRLWISDSIAARERAHRIRLDGHRGVQVRSSFATLIQNDQLHKRPVLQRHARNPLPKHSVA